MMDASDALLLRAVLPIDLFNSPDFTSKLFPDPPHDNDTTLLFVPAGAGPPLDLHIENCQRRCVTLFDTQRIVQFGR